MIIWILALINVVILFVGLLVGIFNLFYYGIKASVTLSEHRREKKESTGESKIPNNL